MESHGRSTWLGLGFLSLISAAGAPAAFAAGGSLTYAHEFTGGADGGYVQGNVVADAAGNIYGETPFNGSTSCFDTPGEGCGTIYKIDPAGVLTVLVTFQGASNGATGYGDLALEGDTLFGEAYGDVYAMHGFEGDLIFSVKTDGSGYRVLHRFNGADGSRPIERPIITPDHVLYGVTSYGGPPCSGGGNGGCGVLYQLNPDGSYVVLHNFDGAAEGLVPGRIVMDSSGTIIGTTTQGGTGNAGIIYTYLPSTGVFTQIYGFNGNNGSSPRLGGISPDGTIYGVTNSGVGVSQQDGTLFALSLAGQKYTLTTLLSFSNMNGADPVSGPLVVANDELIGTTSVGGLHGAGTLYGYKSGTLTTLYNFSPKNGVPYGPAGTPALTRARFIYGTAEHGGTALRPDGGPCQCGGVFRYAR
jgi:uncharacterized repeat protein (TIGR03803 family)